MRKICFVVLGAMLAAGPVLAQPAAAPAVAPAVKPQPRQAQAANGACSQDVNAAYMGGGVVLQGAPGAPAPTPEPTPPCQMPKNMVPTR